MNGGVSFPAAPAAAALRCGGLLSLSLCDFPGRVAAVVFTRGCNFRCPFCHNGHLLAAAPAAGDPSCEEVLARLAARAPQLQGVVVSGGEPTIQAGLPSFLRAVRSLGLAVKLDTNGSRPEVLAELLAAGLLDFVAMDVKAPWERYGELAGVACDVAALRRSVALIAACGRPHLFRTTRVTPLLSPADCRAIEAQIPAGSPHVWQRFRAENSLDSRLRPAGKPA
jgi:pyruvate formate lyase activating enzyme